MTCCPFQYLTRLSDCRVVMMSFCVMEVMALRSLMLSVPLNYTIIQLSRDNPINNAMDIQGKAFKQLKSVLASVTIRCPSKRASLEQFGHKMAAIATPRLPGGPSGLRSRNTVC